MNATIIFKDGKIAVVNNLKFVNKIGSPNTSVVKIDKFEDFQVLNTNYVFVGEKETASISGHDVLYVTFES